MQPGNAQIIWHSSEDMSEIPDASARLVIGASVYRGPDAPWGEYVDLYRRVYIENGARVIRPDGFLVIIQTDAYRGGVVIPRNALLPPVICAAGFRLIDVKIWERRRGDLFQPPFSSVFVFAPPGSRTTRAAIKHPGYFRGVWQYPQTRGGAHNAWPDELCRLLTGAFTEPGDLIVDPFAGTGRLLGVAAALGRRAVGYEIDETLRGVVSENIGVPPLF